MWQVSPILTVWFGGLGATKYQEGKENCLRIGSIHCTQELSCSHGTDTPEKGNHGRRQADRWSIESDAFFRRGFRISRGKRGSIVLVERQLKLIDLVFQLFQNKFFNKKIVNHQLINDLLKRRQHMKDIVKLLK